MALADFDQTDRSRWYFGDLTREQANQLLNEKVDSGTFLVRDSSTMPGEYVLCVREDQRVSHYIINKMITDTGSRFRIGDQDFPDIPSLLNFYKTHYLDTTSLIRPVEKEVIQVIARFDFAGRDPDDLPFRKGEILTVVKKDEEGWWTARNNRGEEGSIPVPYIEVHTEENGIAGVDQEPVPMSSSSTEGPQRPRSLPAYARVVTMRIPNAYDRTALKLEVGDIVCVTATPISGQWEGELNGKTGHFPFTHVQFIEQSDSNPL
ncbi:adapter molecule Crk-like [Watersipora subatra]|uniref:adapter molecule Crk-like n=1 Tax=Watersipora subatra TaxID=2589382 RepID=UPI00355BEACA